MNRVYSLENTWVGQVSEHCDLCSKLIKDVFIDGRVGLNLNFPWGIMCESCHEKTGVPIKWGHAQKYERIEDKWICVKGLEGKNDL
jgi:hypothetical protein